MRPWIGITQVEKRAKSIYVPSLKVVADFFALSESLFSKQFLEAFAVGQCEITVRTVPKLPRMTEDQRTILAIDVRCCMKRVSHT